MIVFIFVALSPLVTASEVVVNKSVPTSGYSKADIRAIFTMQKRRWSNNRQIKVYTLPDSNPLHKYFVKNNLNMSIYHVRKAWDRMTYSGVRFGTISMDITDRNGGTAALLGFQRHSAFASVGYVVCAGTSHHPVWSGRIIRGLMGPPGCPRQIIPIPIKPGRIGICMVCNYPSSFS